MILRVTVIGDPVGKGRPRFVRATGRTYTPERTASWEADAAWAIRRAVPSDYAQPEKGAPLALAIVAVFRRPARLVCSHKKPHARGIDSCPRGPQTTRVPHLTTPDADNVAKAAGDALVKAGAIHDDAQICEVIVSKRYAARGEGPAVHITLHAGSSVPRSF